MNDFVMYEAKHGDLTATITNNGPGKYVLTIRGGPRFVGKTWSNTTLQQVKAFAAVWIGEPLTWRLTDFEPSEVRLAYVVQQAARKYGLDQTDALVKMLKHAYTGGAKGDYTEPPGQDAPITNALRDAYAAGVRDIGEGAHDVRN